MPTLKSRRVPLMAVQKPSHYPPVLASQLKPKRAIDGDASARHTQKGSDAVAQEAK